MAKGTKSPSIVVVNIDNENSFDQPGASLYVPGADKSAEIAAKFFDKNREVIKKIINSFDKHGRKHIFYSMWWTDPLGNHPADFTEITYPDVQDKKWIPCFYPGWSINYAKTLGSFTIWPIHCSENEIGSEMYPVLAEAIARHSVFHHAKPLNLEKGQPEITEFYGMFGAEVVDPQDPRTRINVKLMKYISGFDISFWFGQEAGHCVKRSLEQYITWCSIHNPQAISKMRYVSDCINRLDLGPEYNKMIDDSIGAMVQKGMKIVKSNDPIF